MEGPRSLALEIATLVHRYITSLWFRLNHHKKYRLDIHKRKILNGCCHLCVIIQGVQNTTDLLLTCPLFLYNRTPCLGLSLFIMPNMKTNSLLGVCYFLKLVLVGVDYSFNTMPTFHESKCEYHFSIFQGNTFLKQSFPSVLQRNVLTVCLLLKFFSFSLF